MSKIFFPLLFTLSMILGVAGGYMCGNGDVLIGIILFILGFVVLAIKWKLEDKTRRN